MVVCPARGPHFCFPPTAPFRVLEVSSYSSTRFNPYGGRRQAPMASASLKLTLTRLARQACLPPASPGYICLPTVSPGDSGSFSFVLPLLRTFVSLLLRVPSAPLSHLGLMPCVSEMHEQ